MKFVTWLFDKAFPFCGEIIGKVSSLAMTDSVYAVRHIFGNTDFPITYTNLFTGISSEFTAMPIEAGIIVEGLISIVENLFASLFALFPQDTPFVFAVIMVFFVGGIILSILKFFIGLIK